MYILITAALVFARVSGLIISMPFFNSRLIPDMIKVLFALLLTGLLTSVLPPLYTEIGIGLLLVSMTAEFIFGILIGGTVSLVFASLSVMSNIVSAQVGLAAAIQFNPTMSIPLSPLGNMSVLLATAVFMSSGLHLQLFLLLGESFSVIPINQVADPLSGVMMWVGYCNQMFIVGLQMASPVLILTLLINSFIAILAKVAPSMNMFFSVGFIATMAVGLWLFMYLLPNILTAEQRVLQDVIHNLPKLFELVGP